MVFDGKPYQARGPVDAINSGISMIHQELNPEPHLTIAESIFLKREDVNGIFLNKRRQNERTQKILDDFGFPYPATTLIRPQPNQKVLYYQLMNGLYDAVLILDQNGHIVDCNTRVTPVLAYNRDEMWDMPVADVIKGIG